MLLVARVDEALRQLVVAVAGSDAERQRIFLREVCGQSRGRHGIEIGLAAGIAAEGLVQHVHDRLLACIESLIALPCCSRPMTTSFFEVGSERSLIC